MYFLSCEEIKTTEDIVPLVWKKKLGKHRTWEFIPDFILAESRSTIWVTSGIIPLITPWITPWITPRQSVAPI